MLLARLLGPVEFGLVSVAVVVMTVVNTIHSTGIPNALSQRVAAAPAEGAAALAIAVRLQLLATVGSVAIGVAAAALVALADPELAPYLAVATLTFVPHGLLNLYMSYDNGRHQFGRQAMLLVLYSALKIGLVIALAFVARGLGALVGYAVASLGALALGRRPAGPPSPEERGVASADLLRFAAPVVAYTGLSASLVGVDLILVQVLIGSAVDTGWYAAAQQVARAPYLALGGLAMAVLPVVARRNAANDHAELAHTIRQSVRYAVMLLAPAVAIAGGAPTAILVLLFSEPYAPGAVVLPVLTAGAAALAAFAVLGAALIGMGRPWTPVAIAAVALGATLISGTVLIPAAGILGAAVATAAGGIVALGWGAMTVARRAGEILRPLTAVRVVAAAAACAGLLWVVAPAGLAVVPASFAALVVYAGVLILLGEVDRDDWSRVRAVLRPIAPA